MRGYKKVEFKELLGLTPTAIEISDNEMTIRTAEGRTFKQFHYQDCCESVGIEDVVGDPEALLGHPLRLAAEVQSEEDPGHYDLGMWTFYHLGNAGGYLTLRWYGESNGYYSVDVDVYEDPSDEEGS